MFIFSLVSLYILVYLVRLFYYILFVQPPPHPSISPVHCTAAAFYGVSRLQYITVTRNTWLSNCSSSALPLEWDKILWIGRSERSCPAANRCHLSHLTAGQIREKHIYSAYFRRAPGHVGSVYMPERHGGCLRQCRGSNLDYWYLFSVKDVGLGAAMTPKRFIWILRTRQSHFSAGP